MTIIRQLTRAISILIIALLLLSFGAAYIPPSFTTLFSLLGLGFPVFWILAMGILVVLLLTRIKWYSIITFLSLLITMPVMLRYYEISFSKKKTQSGYSLYNLNTYGLRLTEGGSDQLLNQKFIHDYINDRGYTIVCFQEYPMKGAKHGKFYSNLKDGLDIKNTAMSSYHWDQKYTDYILVTASRFSIVDSSVLKYNSLPFALFTDIAFPEGIIRVYNVHFQSIKLLKERELLMPDNFDKPERFYDHIISAIRKLSIAFKIREEQSILLSESIKHCPYPVIIAGDLNDTPVSYSYRKIFKGLSDASKNGESGFKRTYKLSKIPLQIDYIMHSRSIKSVGYTVTDHVISDHSAISTNFNIDAKK